nr:hypothetical protein BaRGS_025955 [Batillaria attramentaria]
MSFTITPNTFVAAVTPTVSMRCDVADSGSELSQLLLIQVEVQDRGNMVPMVDGSISQFLDIGKSYLSVGYSFPELSLVETQFNTLTDQMTLLKARSGQLDSLLENATNELNALRQVRPGQKVAFHAGMSDFGAKPVSLAMRTPLVFDHVITNEGQGYDASTGVFRAPITGTYLFTASMEAGAGRRYSELSIMLNDRFLQAMQIADDTDYEHSTTTTIAHVQAGDRVDAARVLMLQLSKVESGARTPVASLLTGGSPVAEVQKLNVSVSGHYDNLHPSSSWLRADILDPKEDAEGDYLCIVETVDSHGLLHRYLDTATLTSLNKGGKVPDFYRIVLLELRSDLDTLTDGLNALRNAQTDVTRADNEALAKLSQIDSIYNSIHNGIPVVNKGLSDVAQKEKSMRAELDRLRDITPEVKVSFYAYLSAGGTRPYASVANNNNIVFDRYQQHTDNSYSTSNGIFTCPQNGTYFFRTGVMNSGSTHSYATILADDVEVASVYMYDDYSTKQATASAVVKLVEGERVRVVVRTGSTDTIYGSNSHIPNRVTYFMGLLLWTVQLTCRPPANGKGNKLLLLQLDKVESGSRTPVATALSGQTAVVERKGTLLHASASVHYNSDPLLSTLRTVLLELRADLDNMTAGLDSVINAQRDVNNIWGPATQANPRVSFYTYLSSSSQSVGNNGNIVFNVLEQKTDTSYSTSTGIFTCPHNGTYFFTTGVTNAGAPPTYATLTIGNEPVASLYTYDDSYYKSSIANAVVRHYGVPGKIISLIQCTYQDMSCRIAHAGQLSESFEVKTGVRQGCLLSPFLFLLVIDWIMKTTTAGRKNGIQWTLWTQLDDLDFADDLALLSHSHSQMQDKTTCLEATSAGTGLKINRKKTELMKINTTANTPVTVGGEPIREVESFVYLGSVVDGQGGTDRDVTARIGKARAAMVMLKNVWASKVVSIRTKLRIFNSNVKSVLLYGCETWRTTKTMQQKIQTFLNTCLRRIFNIRWPEKIRNEELWERAGQEPLAKQILRRKWGWIGHTLRKPASSTTRQALTWNPQGKRKRGRPRNSWRRDTEAELCKQGTNWTGVARLAQNRVRWRRVVDGLCSTWSQGPKTVQLTCRPPANGEGNKLLLLQLDKVESGSRTPVATALSGQTAVVERKGTLLHASASLDYNSDPLLSTLRVDLQDPKEDAAGDYLCIAETMDGHGELYQYMATATLTSLGRGGAVPAFYRTVLLELRADLDNMTVGLDSVINAQRDVSNTWGPATEANTKVYFYAYLSSSSIGPGNNANIVFNVLERKTDTSYSTSTGIFTCPHNGTYFFRAGITASGQRAYASIMADDEIVASLYAYDDYSFQSSMASAIVNLVEGDQS